jgi:hypothetical protein
MIHANHFVKTTQQVHLHITCSMPVGNSFPTYSHPPLQTATREVPACIDEGELDVQ